MDDTNDDIEPIFETSSWLSGRGLWSGSLTKTGLIWIAAPWYLIWKRKLKFSIMHLLIFSIFMSISVGFMVTGLIYKNYSALFSILIMCAVVHTHCMALVFSLWSFAKNNVGEGVVIIVLIVCSAIPLVFWGITGMYLNNIFRV